MQTAVKELLNKMADDQLVIGHRNAEWTGIGPILEEDISFASIAQDKVGHAKTIYQHLHELGLPDPDQYAFMRTADEFKNAQFTELPIGDYDFSLMRHFLFDMAEIIRFEMLKNSSYQPIADISARFYAETKYHVMHAKTWIRQLGNSTEEARDRMQTQLEYALPYALGLFEPSPYEDIIIEAKIFEGEDVLRRKWQERVAEVISHTTLDLPDFRLIAPIYGGRTGEHTEHLEQLLSEMSEVFRLDPSAEW